MPRVEVLFSDCRDPRAHAAKKLLSRHGLNQEVVFCEAYNIDGLSWEETYLIAADVFADAIVQRVAPSFFINKWRVEVGFQPGITDNSARVAEDAIKEHSGKEVRVASFKVYVCESKDAARLIAKHMGNPLVNAVHVLPPGLMPSDEVKVVKGVKSGGFTYVDVLSADDQRLKQISRERLLALSLDEMKAIKHYYQSKEVQEQRKERGLEPNPTDVELEAIAQTWSEHCKHKIFNAEIEYVNADGEKYTIYSLFNTFIRGATEEMNKDFVLTAFVDNAGVIKFNEEYGIAVKVETHNSPSALEPYGGALTGILGVNRDVLGTGLGAMPIANVDMLCFGMLDAKLLPPGVLHPQMIYDGVIQGIQDGGNKAGIPNINGSITFYHKYNARPLVYCGTIGLLPNKIGERKGYEKEIKPGYLAVMVGGRVGKDGIHGATFSSQQLEEGIPSSVVQIGDPFTQKKMTDFLLEARDLLLYSAITDNGAGGLSSSIGEMGEEAGGCEIWLDKVPLKYPGLDAWEILVSESQERMTLAVPPENYELLEELAKKHDVEISVVGKFTSSGRFDVYYGEQVVCSLDMHFFHHPPKMKLKAVHVKRDVEQEEVEDVDYDQLLEDLLQDPNVRSKERTVRRYDHEVLGATMIKQFMDSLSPTDAGVIKPLYNSWEGVVVSHGLLPRAEHDTYKMAQLSMDEAVRNAVCVGGDVDYMCALDNFCWPDPIESERTPDGKEKLGDLVRCVMGLYDISLDYGVPLISGKDSMKNDYYIEGKKYSIPPTLLVTIVGKISDVRKCVSSEFKSIGSTIYLLGETRNEMGASLAYHYLGKEGIIPSVDGKSAINMYRALRDAIYEGYVESAHDVSDGGMITAVVESSFPLERGAELQLEGLSLSPFVSLFSESPSRIVVSVRHEHTNTFEHLMAKRGVSFARIGRVRGDRKFLVKYEEDVLIERNVEELRRLWGENPL